MIKPIVTNNNENKNSESDNYILYFFEKQGTDFEEVSNVNNVEVVLTFPYGSKDSGENVFIRGNFTSIYCALTHTFTLWRKHNGEDFLIGQEADAQKISAFSEMFIENLCINAYQTKAKTDKVFKKIQDIQKERQGKWECEKYDMEVSLNRVSLISQIFTSPTIKKLIESLTCVVPSIVKFNNPYYTKPFMFNIMEELDMDEDSTEDNNGSSDSLDITDGLSDKITKKNEGDSK